MLNKQERLNNYLFIDEFLKSYGDEGLLIVWDRLATSDLSSLSDAARNQERNETLIKAADNLPSGLSLHTKAKYLLSHIIDFELLKLPDMNAGKKLDLIPLEQCIFDAYKTGSQIPKSDTQIYNILKKSY